MIRSWAYILMFAATLAGVVALVWPSPQVQTIEEIAMPVRTAPPRAEPPPKAAKATAKTPPSARREPPAPAPPAVVKKMPAPNTTTRRQLAQPDNGMQPSPLNRIAEEAARTPPPAPSGPKTAPPRPAFPFKPGESPTREPAAR
jgi:hypothetical protein